MSKTFKSAVTGHSRRLHLEKSKHGVNIHVSDPEWRDGYGITIAPSDAPALALAILETAGVESPYFNLGDAVDNLRQHVEREAKHAAEAKAQAKLEAEALELFNVKHGTDLDDWKYADRSVVSGWVSVARKAREIGAKK